MTDKGKEEVKAVDKKSENKELSIKNSVKTGKRKWKISLFSKKKEPVKKHVKEWRTSIKKEAEKKHKNNEIKTPIDELLELVVKTDRIKMKDVAKKFGVDKTKIELWSKILEDHDLIEIYYPPIGEPELRRKVIKKEKHGKKAGR